MGARSLVLFYWRRFVSRLRRLLGLGEQGAFYIGSNEALPPPLTPQEEAALLARLPSG